MLQQTCSPFRGRKKGLFQLLLLKSWVLLPVPKLEPVPSSESSLEPGKEDCVQPVWALLWSWDLAQHAWSG